MRYMTTAEIREKYLNYFQEKGCKLVPSSSLIPDDPSLLLTSAGMVQFKPYFLQQKQLEAPYIGTTSVQKCVRTNDIDIIGTTGRHLSFFEMLGNFSFGEYFKEEMCAWAYDFSVNVLGLPPERLYFTVFEDDDETIEIWKNLGVPEDHISRLGEDDNFWRAGPTGPCGPCSEIYYDQGPEFGCGSPDCAPGCDCDRFLEYWNCVFTQYDGQEDGTLAPLPKKNIDTGMGLERMAAIMQGVQSNYETDVLRSLVAVGERLAGVTYGEDAETDLALRIIADHSRSVTFMIADGILPGNEGRGYVLRRLLRRAIMKAQLIGIEGHFLNEYVDEIVRLMGDVYPEIVENRELERGLIMAEEDRFGATLRQGQAYLEEALGKLEGDVLSGEEAFTLHDTYGFPVEVTQEIAEGRGVKVDMEAFEAAMEAQRERARAAGAKDAEAAWSTYGGIYSDLLNEFGPTEFIGYDTTAAETRVLAVVVDGERVGALAPGQTGEVVLAATPFYAEMGGEVGDTGVIENGEGRLYVLDTKAPEKGLFVHAVRAEETGLAEGDTVVARVDANRRAAIERNHTATHILHAALRRVLGDHVKQAGSYVGPDRLRFDFTHFEACTPEQLAEVEREANEHIMSATPTTIYETSLEEARAAGVTGLVRREVRRGRARGGGGRPLPRAVRRLPCGQHRRDRLFEDHERVVGGRQRAPHRGRDELRRARLCEQGGGRAEGGRGHLARAALRRVRARGGRPEGPEGDAHQGQARQEHDRRRYVRDVAFPSAAGAGGVSRHHRAHRGARRRADAQYVGRRAQPHGRARRHGGGRCERRQARTHGRRHRRGRGGGLQRRSHHQGHGPGHPGRWRRQAHHGAGRRQEP